MEESSNKFIEWYGQLLPHERRYVKKQTMILCQVSAVTFYKWSKGLAKIKRPYRTIINDIAGFDVLPVENAEVKIHVNFK